MGNLEKDENGLPIFTTGRLKEIECEIIGVANALQLSVIQLGKLVFEGRKLCEENNLDFNKWCEYNIGIHHKNCVVFIRIWETFEANGGFFSGNICSNSFRRLDIICRLSEPIYEIDSKSKNVISKNEDGSRKMNIDEVNNFLKEYPEFDNMTLNELRIEVKKRKEVIEENKRLNDILTNQKEHNEEYIQNKLKLEREQILSGILEERKKIEMQLNFKKEDVLLKLSSLKKKEEDLKKKEQEILRKDVLVETQNKRLSEIKKRIDETKKEFEAMLTQKEGIIHQIDNMKEISKFIKISREYQRQLSAFMGNKEFSILLEDSKINDSVISPLIDISDLVGDFKSRINRRNNIVNVDWNKEVL